MSPRRPRDTAARPNPFAGVNDYFSEIVRMRTQGVHGSVAGAADPMERTHASAWVPPTDILAVGDDLVIRIDLAGVEPELVDLTFSHGVLTVSGSRPADDDGEAVVHYAQERYHGEFRRMITLPERTEAEQISAEFENGLVQITVAGAAVTDESTRIEVSTRSKGSTRRTLKG